VSIRIGWSVHRPRVPRPGEVGHHVGLFEYTRIEGERGRKVVVGWLRLEPEDLLRLRAKGVRLHLRVIGVLSVAPDVEPDLFLGVVKRLNIAGSLRAPSLAGRIP